MTTATTDHDTAMQTPPDATDEVAAQPPDEQADAAETQPDAAEGLSGADWLHVCQLREDLATCAFDEHQIAEQHKDAKKRTETAQTRLNQAIDELREPNLFSGDQPAVASLGSDELWPLEPVSALTDHGAKAGAVKALVDRAPPIGTLGELSDYMAGECAALTDIAGIGPVAATSIEDALQVWFAANPEKCPPECGATRG